MRLIDCKDFNSSAGTIRNTYITICDTYLYRLNNHKSLGLAQIRERFNLSLDDIKELIRTIVLSEDGFINTPENNRNSILLRYLEYGGEGIRPTHLLSQSKKILYNKLNERR